MGAFDFIFNPGKAQAQAAVQGANISAAATTEAMKLQRDMFNDQLNELREARANASIELQAGIDDQIRELESSKQAVEARLQQGFGQAEDITTGAQEQIVSRLQEERAIAEGALGEGFTGAEQELRAGDQAADILAATQGLETGLGEAGAGFRADRVGAQQQLGTGLGTIRNAGIQAGQELDVGTGALQTGQTGAEQALTGAQADQLAAIRGAQQQALGLGEHARTLGGQGLEAFASSALDPDSENLRFQLGEITEATNQNLAARGLLNSSAGLKALEEAQSGVIRNEAQDRIARQQALAGMGAQQTAAGQNILGQTAAQEANVFGGTGSQLAGIAERGGSAQAQLATQQAGLAERGGLAQADLLGQSAALQQQGGLQQAGLTADAAQAAFGGDVMAAQAADAQRRQLADIELQRGQALSGLGQQFTGQEISALGTGAANLANLAQTRGTTLANLTQGTSQNVANALGARGSGMANLYTGTGAQAAQATGLAGQQIANMAADRGDILGGGVAQAGAARSQGQQALLGGLIKLGTAGIGAARGGAG